MTVPPLTSDAPSLAGSIVGGKYRVVRLIGTGGMGTVWEGVHVALGTRVAIKFIKPRFSDQAEARARFEIEARAAAKLTTKHAVHVFDYGVSPEGLPYIVMEFLDGESLSDAIIGRGPLEAPEVAQIIVQASRALTRAHAAGIVHRDLKPDNIYLATSDEPVESLPYVVKLVDFGIAKIFEEDPGDTGRPPSPMGGPTREGTVIGTPNFMAPEQLTIGGAPGPLTDLWSLGACTFAAMTGRLPFEGDVLGDIVLKVCAAPMPTPSKINPRVPPGFDAWFARACSRDPVRRFQTADELAQALAGVCGMGRIRMATLDEDAIQYVMRPKLDSETIESIPPPAAMSAKTALLAGLVLGIAMMVGLLGFFAWHERSAGSGGTAPAPAQQPAP
ncbi:MAG TPA: serine/threonine-protein kinase [Polyangiaceae bacterium]|jgi:serine/threonine-protein kinase|nr:serine/threonine-protein kinase [Polyangiaceae bacterium]